MLVIALLEARLEIADLEFGGEKTKVALSSGECV
jgi:hypothetical protein